jgi:hypothetical protein
MTTAAGDAGAAGAAAGAAGAAGAGDAGAAKGAAAPWHGYTEQADIDYVTNKGWQGPQDAIKAARGAEKLIGRDPNTLLVMPRADDPVGLRGVFSKLGLPETADKYEFAKPPEGIKQDDGYVNWARGTFHKLGLLPGQVKELTTQHNEYVKGVIEKQQKDYNLSVETDKAALRAEWKDGHERMLLAGESAAKSLGFTGDMIDAIERTVGYAATHKFFASLGQKLGEGKLVTGEGKGFNGGMTPAEAKAEWEKTKVDPVWQAAAKDPMHPGNEAAKKKQNDLFAIMYPKGA